MIVILPFFVWIDWGWHSRRLNTVLSVSDTEQFSHVLYFLRTLEKMHIFSLKYIYFHRMSTRRRWVIRKIYQLFLTNYEKLSQDLCKMNEIRCCKIVQLTEFFLRATFWEYDLDITVEQGQQHLLTSALCLDFLCALPNMWGCNLLRNFILEVWLKKVQPFIFIRPDTLSNDVSQNFSYRLWCLRIFKVILREEISKRRMSVICSSLYLVKVLAYLLHNTIFIILNLFL